MDFKNILVLFLLCQVYVGKPLDRDHCSKEKVGPNLVLQQPKHVQGRVGDKYGAPLNQHWVELRTYISPKRQTSVIRVKTDADGNFNLGSVRPGKYRLLAADIRAFDQPSNLQCSESQTCILEISLSLTPYPTDAAPFGDCPVK